MADLRKRFGKLVASHRRRRGLTQLQLAEAANLSQTMIVRIEGGSSGARFPSIERIASALGVDPADLFMAASGDHKSVPTALIDINAQLAGLAVDELGWVRDVIDVILKRRP